MDHARGAGAHAAVDDGRGLVQVGAVADFGEQRVEACAVAEFDAGGVAPLRRIEVARQRNLRIARTARIPDPVLRTPEDGGNRYRGIGGNRHERGIRAILQQPADQISQQIAVAADRRVHPARRRGIVGQHEIVEHLSHAVQALELVPFHAAGILDHARHGERVVGGELRIEPRAGREQFARAGDVAEVGHRLAGKHRIVGEPALLGALDLGVPIRALDQSHHEAATEPARGLIEPIDHCRSALEIGLHRQAETVPAAQRGVGQHGCDHVEGEFEPVGLLRVHGEIDVMLARHAGKLERLGHQLDHDLVAR